MPCGIGKASNWQKRTIAQEGYVYVLLKSKRDDKDGIAVPVVERAEFTPSLAIIGIDGVPFAQRRHISDKYWVWTVIDGNSSSFGHDFERITIERGRP